MNRLQQLVPSTPRGSTKRKSERTDEAPSKSTRISEATTPSRALPLAALSLESAAIPTPFSIRPNAGTTIETLNLHIPAPTLPLGTSWESRVKLTVNMDLKKFSYRPMHQKLTEASEVLDDRIDEFMNFVQEHYQFADEQFGNPSTASPSEVVVVGRIASDSLDGKLNTASMVLESSRRMGAGSRIPLKLDAIRSFSFFPGQIVAVKGVNASGNYFAVSEILEIPTLPTTATSASEMTAIASRLSAGPLTIMVASGPYTTEDNLHFEALDEICRRAVETSPDVVILTGPFIDSEHSLIKIGDFDIEGVDGQENGTLEDLFRVKISRKIKRIEKSLVLLVPTIRDAVSRHISFPQEPIKKRILELPLVRSRQWPIPSLPTPVLTTNRTPSRSQTRPSSPSTKLYLPSRHPTSSSTSRATSCGSTQLNPIRSRASPKPSSRSATSTPCSHHRQLSHCRKVPRPQTSMSRIYDWQTLSTSPQMCSFCQACWRPAQRSLTALS